MPADQTEERKSAMAAFGAELISVPSSSDGGGMEAARDLAARMQVSHCLGLPGPPSLISLVGWPNLVNFFFFLFSRLPWL